MENNLKIILNVSILTLIVMLARIVFHTVLDVEFITAIGLFASYLFESQAKILLTIMILFITNFLIVNSIIFIFAWSSFITILLLAHYLKLNKSNSIVNFFKLESIAIFSTIIFFLWTNFGVVVTTNMYEKNIYGLIESYVNALSFLENQIIGNLVITTLLFGVMFLVNLEFDKVNNFLTKRFYHLFNL